MLRIRTRIIFRDPNTDPFPDSPGSGSVSYSNGTTKITRRENLTKYTFCVGPVGPTDKENQAKIYKKYCFRYITSLKRPISGSGAVSNSRIRIRIKLKSRFQIRIKLKSRFQIRIKVKSITRIRIKRVWIHNTDGKYSDLAVKGEETRSLG